MSGDPVIAPRRVALFGKTAAHGDFVRRGDAALVGRLDAWLTGEVERLARAGDDTLDELLAGMTLWSFVLPDGVAGALGSSHDRVGRVFPLVCCADGGRGVAEGAATLIERTGAELLDADMLAAGLTLLGAAADQGSGEPDTPGWWRPGAEAPAELAITGLPVGADFDRLLDQPEPQDVG